MRKSKKEQVTRGAGYLLECPVTLHVLGLVLVGEDRGDTLIVVRNDKVDSEVCSADGERGEEARHRVEGGVVVEGDGIEASNECHAEGESEKSLAASHLEKKGSSGEGLGSGVWKKGPSVEGLGFRV
jgi:hypothetical protein